MSPTTIMRAINPVTGETAGEYPGLDVASALRRVGAAHAAHFAWKQVPIGERAALLRNAAEVLRRRQGEFAALMAVEMGKPVSEGAGEVAKCAWVCEYYADHGPAFLAPETIATDAARSFVAFEPLGTVLAVMPWNFPFWQVFRFAAPALLAGNAAVLKHASNVPGCAIAIEEVFRSAGFPDDVFTAVLVGSAAVGGLIDAPEIAAVTLTGSTPAGRAVAARAGAALKKTVLELGGSDPYVILEDADLDVAVAACAAGRLINGGQSCIAAKRFVVVPAIRDEFEERLVAAMGQAAMGDPLDPATTLGPQARADLRDELHDQVVRSVAAGARLRLGGVVPPGPGAFYPATVLTGVAPAMPAAREEVFGPVAAVIPVADEEEAIRVANDSPFGLGAAVFTRDVARGEEIAARRLEAGSVFVNAFVRSDPRLPFGGIKESGYGRELSSFGIREFVNVKTVYVA